MGILKLRRWEGRLEPEPLPAAEPPDPLQARDPDPDTDPLSPDDVDMAEDMYCRKMILVVYRIQIYIQSSP